MKVTVYRTAMIGGGLAYDVYVPAKDAPAAARKTWTLILRDEQVFMEYPYATLPVEHYAMPQGLDRWDDWKRHEAKAHAEMLAIIQQTFPETRKLTKWPVLWCVGLAETETDHCATIEVQS